ncbi:MAG: PQQ-binding-like beta-propeller repeat protein [Candidatus Kerfeldbacteria bacterium]|nr:PQQ-binding-like beta-propeller repeat protein [Candidatus Kerfeldbacteria bacterium]
MFQHDQRHSGRSSVAGPVRADTLWTRQLGGESVGPSAAPVIGNDGRILIGTMQGGVYAFSPQGTRLWKTLVPGTISAPLGVASNGRILVPTENDTSFVLDPSNGHILWRLFVGLANSGPTMVGNVAFLSGNYSNVGFVWKLDLQALAYVWQSSHLRLIDRSSPVVALGGQIAVGTIEHVSFFNSSGLVTILNSTGTEQCSYDLGFFRGRGVRSTLAQTSTGRLVGGSAGDQASLYGDGVFVSSDITCTSSCTPPDIGHYFSSPAITSSDRVVVGTKNGVTVRDQNNCSQTALYPTGPILNASPVIDNQGSMYVGDDNGRLWAWSGSGSLLWSTQLDAATTSIAIDAKGSLFVASTAGHLYCFAGPGVVTVEPVHQAPTDRMSLWPNPTQGHTTIELALTKERIVSCSVYDVSGRPVARIFSGLLGVGAWSWAWPGQDDHGRRLSRGLYWVTARIGSHRITKMIVLL